jgi:hypothetical protein
LVRSAEAKMAACRSHRTSRRPARKAMSTRRVERQKDHTHDKSLDHSSSSFAIWNALRFARWFRSVGFRVRFAVTPSRRVADTRTRRTRSRQPRPLYYPEPRRARSTQPCRPGTQETRRRSRERDDRPTIGRTCAGEHRAADSHPQFEPPAQFVKLKLSHYRLPALCRYSGDARTSNARLGSARAHVAADQASQRCSVVSE